MGWRSGWNGGRPSAAAAAKAMPKAKAKARAKAAPAPVALPLAPVGRQNNQDVKLMRIQEWYAHMRQDIATSSQVLLASPWYDNPDVQQALLNRLKKREPFSLVVLIDKASFDGVLPKRQKERITALRTNGAKIFLCTGERRENTFHKKAVIIDRRYLYVGGANITYASDHGNGELVYRMVGHVVSDTLAVLVADQARGREWID